MLDSTQNTTKICAMNSLVSLCGTKAIHPLAHIVNTDNDPRVRRQATQSLVELINKASEIPEDTLEMLATLEVPAITEAVKKALQRQLPDFLETDRIPSNQMLADAAKRNMLPEACTVGVIYFTCEDVGQRVTISTNIENGARDALTRNKRVRIVTRRRLREVCEEKEIYPSAVLTREQVKEIGTIAKADAIITGRFKKRGKADMG